MLQAKINDAQRKSICDGRIFIERPARTNALLKIFCWR